MAVNDRASNNPVLRGMERDAASGAYGSTSAVATPTAQQLDDLYALPSAVPPTDRAQGRMTVDDVIMRTGMLFGLLVVGAVAGWFLVSRMPAVVWVSMIAALVLGLVISFKRSTNPPLIVVYSLIEGVFLGGISAWYSAIAGTTNVVLQAVIGTFAAFAAMLVLYRSRIVKVDGRFMKMFMIAMFAYAGIALVSLIAAVMGVGGGWGFYGVGGLGLLLCAAGVLLAAFSLVMDFAVIEDMTRAGVPEKEAWRGAFGLIVSLVWLYLELLRLFTILNQE